MRLFDTHCHLMDDRFAEDREAVILRMREAGLEKAVSVEDVVGPWRENAQLCRAHDFLYAAVGLHPQNADRWNAETEKALEEALCEPKTVALGEIGLDYHYEDQPPRDVQIEAFEAQMDMALARKLPAILHIRDAHGDCTEILTRRYRQGRLPRAVLHCYSGSWESAKAYLAMGLYISFTGSVTFKNTAKLKDVARNLPLERLMLETDCPYMAPEPVRGRRNEPANVAHIARCVAALRGMADDDLASAATDNGCRFFTIEHTR